MDSDVRDLSAWELGQSLLSSIRREDSRGMLKTMVSWGNASSSKPLHSSRDTVIASRFGHVKGS